MKGIDPYLFALSATAIAVALGIFFRSRRKLRAEREKPDITGDLVDGACKTLGLGSAAVFRAAADGGFIRERSVGWDASAAWHLLANDRIVQKLREAGETALDVSDLWPPGVNVPRGFARPVVGMAVAKHGAITALVFYGAHNDGRAIEVREIRALVKGWSASTQNGHFG